MFYSAIIKAKLLPAEPLCPDRLTRAKAEIQKFKGLCCCHVALVCLFVRVPLVALTVPELLKLVVNPPASDPKVLEL